MEACEIEDINDIYTGDLREIIEDSDKDDILREYVISLMTDEEKRDEFYNSCDGYLEGESCNI